MDTAKRIEAYIDTHSTWSEGLLLIRKMLLDTELIEDIKWSMPAYTYEGKNIIGLAALKHHMGVWFHHGVFLDDPHQLLENAQKGKTKGMRHIKYQSVEAIDLDILTPYVDQAIQNAKDGKFIEIRRTSPQKLPIPSVLSSHLGPEGISQLEALSAGKRNEYIIYITSAKRASTVSKRLDKIFPMILAGKGLNDMYKK